MYEGLDTTVLYDELAYNDILPLHWQALTAPLAVEVAHQHAERNLRVLQACTALEEQGQTEKSDDSSAHAADILRLELKVNLLLDLVGRILVTNQPHPAPVPILFNARGACWQAVGSRPAAGDLGVLELYLKECLVEPLRLFGRVQQVSAAGEVKLKYDNPGEAVANLIEKLAFRRHRRQVADQRQPRTFDPSRTGRFKR
jgi:hypothetical protein